VAALTLGLIVVFQAQTFLGALGLEGGTEGPVVRILIRELPAITVALILIARSATAVATELATMRLNQELDGLAAHGIPVETLLLVPRWLAFPLASACLVFYFIVIAVVSGPLLLPLVSAEPLSLSIGSVVAAVRLPDVLLPLGKGLLFGFLIAVLSSASGLAVGGSFREVPRAATRAVTACLTSCMIANAVLSLVSFGPV
jgi:phospholipid/cholesterol/gamma-HCH transport system permease protein